MVNRRRQASTTAQALARRYGIDVEPHYDDYGRGWTWSLRWSNGPSYTTMRSALNDVTGHLAPDISNWDLHRIVQDDALAVQTVRLALAGDLYGDMAPDTYIEHVAQQTDDPDRPVSEREALMARRLLEVTGGSRMGTAVCERGLAWLLQPPLSGADGPGSAGHDGGRTAVADDRQAAVELLTARYATGEAHRRWERQLQALPVRDALDAALVDPDPPIDCVTAALTLLPVIRAETTAWLDEVELQTMATARNCGCSWRQIGDRMGISAQAAQQRAVRRTDP